MEWLKVNDDGEVEFASEEIKLVPEIATLLKWSYNKGYKGDIDGRKRYRAADELKYLYLAFSPRGPYKDYSEKERLEEAMKDCKFHKGWVESTELLLAIKKYEKGSVNRVTKSMKIVERFLDKFESHLEGIDLNERNNTGSLVHAPQNIMKTLQELPRFLSTLQLLEQQARLGIAAAPTSKGDHEIGWMNGQNDGRREKEEVESDGDSDTERASVD